MYGIIYTIQFSSIGTHIDYHFDILKQGYAGNYFNLTGSAAPVIQSCQVDEPKAPIKGTSVKLTYINEGSNPLSSFYSPSDTTYKGQLWKGNKLLFEGFMIQDDSSEIFLDMRHEVSLSFNDGLGLLKDITLDLAYAPGFNPAQTITEELYEFKSLMDIIKHCIYCTGLELGTRLYEQIFESEQLNHQIFLEETSVNMETFLGTDNKWDNCYTVLEKILGWYKLTLFQAHGFWNIVRWNDLRYYNGAIPGYQFDKVMTLLGSITLDETISFGAPIINGVPTGQTNNAETGLLERILRPYKFVQNTFNYKRPTNFKNADFLLLGDLIREYQSGTGTGLVYTYEYVAAYWAKYTSQPGEIFIRVIKNYLKVETERYLVIKTQGSGTDSTLAAISSGIEVAENDFVSLTFSVRAVDFPVTSFFGLRLLYSPTYTRWAKDSPLGWQSTGFWGVLALQDNQWNTVEIDPVYNLPSDGVLQFFPASLMSTVGGETHYRDIRLKYDIRISESINIIGHIHKDRDTDPLHVIKNNEDTEIFIDDSPKNSILGTTFNAGQDIGYLHKRTNVWYRGTVPTERFHIGRILTFEQEFWRRKPRTILEGTINGISDSNGNVISLLTRMTNDQLPGLNFIFGRQDIDYRNNSVSGTLLEMYQEGEQDSDLQHEYTLTYIYKTET